MSWIGGTNTLILLTSSFAMAVAVRRNSTRAIDAVLVLGLAFLGFKALEWTLHIRAGIVPGSGPRGESLFYSLYYLMTGLHAAHVVAGLVLVAWARARPRRVAARGPVLALRRRRVGVFVAAVLPMRALVITYAGLVALALTSWALSSTDLSLAIAAVKAAWIGWVFMELRTAHVVPRTIAVVAVLFVALLLAGTLADVDLRG